MAEVKPRGKVTLYLETWQKRMIRDYLKSLRSTIAAGELPVIKLREKIVIDFSRQPMHLNTYRVPTWRNLEDEGWEFYFSDVQKVQVQEVTGLKAVDSMRVTAEMLKAKIISFN